MNPLQELQRYHKESRGTNAHAEAWINKEISGAFLQSIRKQCRDSQKSTKILFIIENGFGLAPEVQKPKRVASSQLEEETLRAKKRTKDYVLCTNLQISLRLLDLRCIYLSFAYWLCNQKASSSSLPSTSILSFVNGLSYPWDFLKVFVAWSAAL